MKRLSLLALVSGFVFGQTFDVATIRPSALPTGQLAKALQSGQLRLGMQIQGNQVSFGLMGLRELAAIAYEVKPLQVTGPDWIAQQRYDITALMPEGSDQKQVPAMLRALLTERFKLVARKSDAEQQVYALEVAKDGHKMKEAPPLAPETPLAPGGIRAGGTTVMNGGAAGATKGSFSPDGRMHMEVERMTMTQLADLLTPFMDFPVVDRTGLTGAFSLAIDLAMGDLLNVARRAGAAIPAGALPAGGRGGFEPGMAAQDPGGDMTAAVQKLGLRLNKQKAPVNSLVIESAEKTPTEN